MESETNTLPASLMAEKTRNTTMAMAMKKPSTIKPMVCAESGQTSQRAMPFLLLVALQVWHRRDWSRKAKWVAQLVEVVLVVLLRVMPLVARSCPLLSKYWLSNAGFEAPKHAGG